MYAIRSYYANEGVYSVADLQEELLNLADEQQLLRMVNQRSGGTSYNFV